VPGAYLDPETPKYPMASWLGEKALPAVSEFMSKPFGYDNPPGRMMAEAFVGPVARTATRIGYGEDPVTEGTGQTRRIREDVLNLPNPLKGLGAGKAMFMGIRALNTDKRALALAQKMEAAGHDPEKIWTDTGFFKSPDGHWKWEATDHNTAFKGIDELKKQRQFEFDKIKTIEDAQVIQHFTGKGLPLLQATEEAERYLGHSVSNQSHQYAMNYSGQELIDRYHDYNNKIWKDPLRSDLNTMMPHVGLANNYPDMKYMGVRLEDQEEGIAGSFHAGLAGTPGTVTMRHEYVLPNGDGAPYGRSHVLHELQHAVAAAEGHDPGANVAHTYKQRNAKANEYMQLQDNFLTTRAALGVMKENPGMTPEIALKEIIDSANHYGRAPTASDREIILRMLGDPKNYPEDRLAAYASAARGTAQNHGMITRDQGLELYRKNIGETEARATQKRMDMTPDQRRARFPMKDYDPGPYYTAEQLYDSTLKIKP
jgi:hypothetical protein